MLVPTLNNSDKKRPAFMKLNLSKQEKANLRRNKKKMSDLASHTVDEIEDLLGISQRRAEEIHALAAFQQIPSIGEKFARDLIFLGFHALEELKGQDAASLLDAYEQKKGYWTDPCVEDQFHLAVYVANTGDFTRSWWDFTAIRKQYRKSHGYPPERPGKSWFEERVAP
jgi:hypothetical protein